MGTYSFDEILGVGRKIGRDVKFGVKYSVDRSLSVLGTKWRLRSERKKTKKNSNFIQLSCSFYFSLHHTHTHTHMHKLTAPVSMSYMRVPRLHQSTALP